MVRFVLISIGLIGISVSAGIALSIRHDTVAHRERLEVPQVQPGWIHVPQTRPETAAEAAGSRVPPDVNPDVNLDVAAEPASMSPGGADAKLASDGTTLQAMPASLDAPDNPVTTARSAEALFGNVHNAALLLRPDFPAIVPGVTFDRPATPFVADDTFPPVTAPANTVRDSRPVTVAVSKQPPAAILRPLHNSTPAALTLTVPGQIRTSGDRPRMSPIADLGLGDPTTRYLIGVYR